MIVADGQLAINSSPQGASITIDKQFSGVTPLLVDVAPFTKHKVELFLEGYLKATRSIAVKPEQQADLNVDLTPNIGTVQLRVSPADATIKVDGKSQGSGSQTLSLNAKPHSISVEKSGYQTKSMTVTPRPGHQQALTVKLLTLEQAYWASRPPTVKQLSGYPVKTVPPRSAVYARRTAATARQTRQ